MGWPFGLRRPGNEIMTKIWSVVAGTTLLLLPATLHAQDVASNSADRAEPDIWRISTGVNYSRGDYGDVADTEVISSSISAKYAHGPVSVRVSVPFVYISGPGSLIDTPQGGGGSGGSQGGTSGGSGGGVVGGAGANRERSGIGDVSVRLGYEFELGESTWFDMAARVKLPTASHRKAIGTGKVDVTLSGELTQDVGNASFFVGSHYRFIDSPTGASLRKTYGFSGGASYQLGSTIVGVDYDWARSANQGAGPSSEVTGWINFKLAERLRMQAYGSTGFTTNSADVAGGLSLSYRFR